MVSKGRLAAASQVATPQGVMPASQLRVGMQAWAVSTTGQITLTEILANEPVPATVDIARILTRSSEVLAPAASYLAGAKGPVAAGALSPGPHALELVAPGDLPPPSSEPRPLEGIDSMLAVIPEEMANLTELRERLRRADG